MYIMRGESSVYWILWGAEINLSSKVSSWVKKLILHKKLFEGLNPKIIK